MSTKREEERNEKIIRGLMKLPPNRRCINCNTLGPQYVCINFWTFVCMTCSGIHREFTHRVKSVSMSKFTSQEVEALQNGGNQRAKEMFLKDWDFQRQRQPSGNNIERIREFIKHVYVDKKYAAGKSSEKPPRDTQDHLKTEAETRRASSYHSYSQSPPYDFQYEERWNRKQGIMLTRKPGSDRGTYEGKVSGLYSPGRYSDHVSEERFRIEGSSSRASDYSMSSGGDPFRSHPQSPNSLKDSGFNSPTFEHSKGSRADDIRYQTGNMQSEIHAGGDGVAAPNAKGTVSSAASGDRSAASLNPLNSTSFFDAFPEPDQPSAVQQNNAAAIPSVSQSFAPPNNSNVDLFKELHGKHPVNVAPSTDLFQSPAVQPLVDLFKASGSFASSGTSGSSHTPPLSSLSFFEDNSQNSSGASIGAVDSRTAPSDVGWATFDLPQHASTSKSHDFAAATEHSGYGSSVGKFSPLSTSHANTHWPDFLGSSAHEAPPLMSSPQHENLHTDRSLEIASNSQEWKPFDDIKNQRGRDGQVLSDKPSTMDHFMGSMESENLNRGISQVAAVFGPVPGLSLHAPEESSSTDQSGFALMGELHSHFERSTSNPFDIPYEADLDASNSVCDFYDMSSLQAALPSTDFSISFTGGMNDSWFLQDAADPCAPTPPPGGLSFTEAQAPSSQLTNVQTHGPVASVGGNPFA